MPQRKKKQSQKVLVGFLSKNPVIGLIFLAGAIAGYFLFEVVNPSWRVSNENSRINVCFTPGGRCTDLIVKEIARAQRSLHVQAYSFTSRPIAQALVRAAERGVDVRVLIDKSQFKSKHSVLPYLKHHGIPVRRDYVSGIAHNKVIILDDESVITGSFNFTKAAQERNSENVVLVRDAEIASHYMENWKKRRG